MSEKKKNSNKKTYGTITDKGNGKYLVTFDYGKGNGKRVRQSKQFGDYDEAEKALQEHAREMRKNKIIPIKFTVEEMINEWQIHGKSSSSWRITTVYGYNKILDNHFRPFLKAEKIVYPEQITSVLLNTYFIMLKEQKGLDNNTIALP